MWRRRMIAVVVGIGAAGAAASGSVSANADVYSMLCTPTGGGGGTCVEVYTDNSGSTTVHSYWYDASGGWGQNW
jgi:hypothetical protein